MQLATLAVLPTRTPVGEVVLVQRGRVDPGDGSNHTKGCLGGGGRVVGGSWVCLMLRCGRKRQSWGWV